MKQRYRRTLAGLIWVILNPLIMFGVQSVVFKKFLRLEIPNYFLFLLSGLLPWIFITQTLQMTASVYVNAADLLKSFKINPLVLVISQVLDNLFNFFIAFTMMFIPIWFMSDIDVHMGFLFMPLNFVILVLGTTFLSVFISTFNVFFRDASFVLTFVISIVFFLTPIFYPISYIPESYRWIINLNPFYYFIAPFRMSLIDFKLDVYLDTVMRALVFLAGVICFTVIYWRKKKNEFYYYL
jgi:lipopolysaccharide transport system permease protein